MTTLRQVVKWISKLLPFSLVPSVNIPGTPLSLSIRPKRRARKRFKPTPLRPMSITNSFKNPLQQTIAEITEQEKKRAMKNRDYAKAIFAAWLQSVLPEKDDNSPHSKTT